MRSASFILALTLLAGCGSGGIGQEASSVLTPQVIELREAVSAGDSNAAGEKLDQLKLDAARLQQEGKLEGDALLEITHSIAEVERLAGAIPAPDPLADVPLEFPDEPAVQSRDGTDGADGRKGEDGKDGAPGRSGDADDKDGNDD